ncbi:ciliogenesis and planar polarity effector 1 [Gastrophryne carolinensis]
MEIALEVLVSTSIKRKKPCPRLCWLGQAKEAVFLVDEKHVSEISLRSGNVKKTFLKKSSIVALATSANGSWLAALSLSGELSLWSKDLDCLLTVPAISEISQLITTVQETNLKLHLCVSGDGSRVLLATHTGCVYLWEKQEESYKANPQKNRLLGGHWSKVNSRDAIVFPSASDKEAVFHAMFVKNEVLGDSCLCTFVFYSGMQLMTTFLSLKWLEGDQRYNSAFPYNVHWEYQGCSLDTIYPACEPVKSRGALVAAFSKDGLVLALAMNQKDPKATCVLFVNTINFVTVCGSLKSCGSKHQHIPSKYLRSYWVGDMSWTADGLFLACMLKRGSFLLLTRLGELLTLTTFGCSVEFGPAEFIPLHPLITYRPPLPLLESHNANDSLGSVASEADLMRQRFSVTCHPRLPYLIVSDGYMVTVLHFTPNMSPYHFMKSLLLDSTQRLENIRQSLHVGKTKKNGIRVRSLSSLKATLLKDAEKTPSVISTVPSFLQDEEEICGHLERLLQDEDEELDDEEYLKYTPASDSIIGLAEQGRLEFASMYDTIHASDPSTGKNSVLDELQRVKRTLLTAWTTGVTMRNVVERDALLKHTVGCLTHFLSLLYSPKCPRLKSDRSSKTDGRGSFVWAVCMAVMQQCLTALHWDVSTPTAIGHVIKLASETMKLIAQYSQVYSRGLVESFCLLKTVSHSLRTIYHLHFESVDPTLATKYAAYFDFIKTAVFEAFDEPLRRPSIQGIFKEPPLICSGQSVKRMAVLWRCIYSKTLWYLTHLRKHISFHHSINLSPKVQNEEEAMVSLMCHIQAELQSSGQHLHRSLHLLSVTGEEYFLFGSYKKSIQFWKAKLLDATAQGGRRAGLFQTRYYLAILYCHLNQYNLNDAQGLCDQLVKELLIRSNLLAKTEQEVYGVESDQHLLKEIHPEAALAVIQSMGRFMAAYFTNQLLYIFPPHNVCVLPPLHTSTDGSPRVVYLQHSMVACAIRDQNLSRVWTVEYALDLLLISGLVTEAAWLANKLGDWKTSVSMALAYNLYLESMPDNSSEKGPPMPLYLSPVHIFQEKLQTFLGQPPNVDILEKNAELKKFIEDPIEEEDADILLSSVQEMLKAAVMADAEILTDTLHQLMDSAKDMIGKLPGLVPERLYLPAPPLYCPQPSSVSEEDPSDLILQMEKRSRHKLSGVLQRILLLLRAAQCSLPAAQWYIKQIKRARKVMQKIRAKGSLSPLSSLPETLLSYANGRTVFFKSSASDEHDKGDPVSCKVVACFRELCALCWMLHVRERLSMSCRQYQKARDSGKLFKSPDEYDTCTSEHCFEALEWACRMLPFTRVTNCEELIQDIILSLVSELPPVKKVAEIMVKAFPHPDDVRIQLREKYNSVQQRLRHSVINGLEGEEMMSVVIHNVHRVRLKTLRRVQRNIGPPEMHLWEPALYENLDDESHCYDKYSLGNSLSRSTLTDLGRIYSDTDTLSDAFINSAAEDRIEWLSSFSKPVHTGISNKAIRENTRKRGEMHTLPKVGTWEFECDDEEYTNFLDLFLSYLLERDLLHGTRPGIPFLASFSQQLREHELNSLAFDVHTTLKRKLGRTEVKSVFRAGSCYTIHVEPQSDSTVDCTLIPTSETPPISSDLCSVLVLEKPVPSAGRYFLKARPKHSVSSGLFGLQDQGTQKFNEEHCHVPCAGEAQDRYVYRLIQNKHCTPSEELDDELRAKYSNEIKLVEWMIRWSDRRLFCSTGKAEMCHVASNSAIRVKTSSAAILTSIWLLEKPYLIPPQQYFVAPVIQRSVKPNLYQDVSLSDSERRAALSVVPEEDSEQLEECDSKASSMMSSFSYDRSQERQNISSPVKSGDESPLLFEITATEKISSETEDDQDDKLDTPRNPNISISIRPMPTQIQTVTSEAERIVKDPKESFVEEISDQSLNTEHPGQKTQVCNSKMTPAATNVEGPVSSTFPEEKDLLEPAVFAASPLPQGLPDATSLHQPVAASTNPMGQVPDGGQSARSVPSEAVRQLFQDEMFRLLQLQQINFMSLMQVVGSSFAALPAIQNVLQHTAQLAGNQVVNPLVGQPLHQVAPQALQQNPNSVTQNPPRQENDRHCTETTAEAKPSHDLSNKENLQRLPEIEIHTSQTTDDYRIPANLGLLSISSNQVLPLIHSSAPKQPPVNLNALPVTHNFNSFPLLKLHSAPSLMSLNMLSGVHSKHHSRQKNRPPLREAWGPSNAPNVSTNSPPGFPIIQAPSYVGPDSSSIPKTDKNKNWAQPVVNDCLKQAAENLPKLSLHIHQPLLHTENLKRKPEGSLLALPPQNAAMPLLHLHTDPPLYLPSMPSSNMTIPPYSEKLEQSGKSTQAAFTLLKASIPQQSQSLHISPAPRLIPLQNLIAFERDMAQRGDPSERSMQLLKANIQPFEETVKPGDSIKRQKRRSLQEKREKKEKKQPVTFRPEDSIINPNNFNEVAEQEKIHDEQDDLKESNEFVIPLGTFDNALTSAIPAPLLPTMAELHYLASTTKRPPEVQDACTNTDSDVPLHLPPRLFLNLQYDEQQGNTPLYQREETPPTPINEYLQTDLDDAFTGPFLDGEERLPSSADLHYMAASLKNVLPPDVFNNTEMISSDIMQSKPMVGDGVPDVIEVDEQPMPYVGGAPVPSGEPIQKVWMPRGLENDDASSKLQEMAAQLRALQNMADSMERDFANTDLLVNTIENLATALDPDPEVVGPLREPVVPESELLLTNMDLEELVEEEFTLPRPRPKPGAVRISEQPLHVFTSGRAPASSAKAPRPNQGAGQSTMSERLQMTGLSDIADILTDLIAGGMSITELGLTQAQAKALSRQRLQSTSKRSPRERAELRMWMKKKQRERLAEHRRKLDELREREYKPFQPQINANTSISSRAIRQSQRQKNQRGQELLSKHHSHRVSDAMSLMQEMLSDVQQIPATSTKPRKPQMSSHVISLQSPVEEEYERDIVSPWDVPDHINRILNSSRHSISQGSLLNGDSASDSTGSILSKLDWKAIEDMVASVGST